MSEERGSVCVIGAGIAGTEAALQLADRGIRVCLFEMRSETLTPAHRTGYFAELVCSNSFKSDDPTTAAGSLKRELEAMGSFVMQVARQCAVPAGTALAVDRSLFSASLTALVEGHPLITVVRQERVALPDGPVIVATGPLTSPGFESVIKCLVGEARLAFYDAAAPIVDALTLDRDVVFPASRYGKGRGDDYLNAPFEREEYERFWRELVTARRVVDKRFDRCDLFCACQPIEEVARTGLDALRFGALKPVGLTDPRTGRRPWAVAQLRAENRERTAYNLVGFQTNLTWPEQRRVFALIPGLEQAEFVRLGVMHRNTFIDAPRLLDPSLALRSLPRVRFAGQIAGTEGYLEAAASGLVAAVNTYADLTSRSQAVPPGDTVLGALLAYATDESTLDYQPIHVNYGIVPPLPKPVRSKRDRYAAYAARSRESMARWVSHRFDLFGGVATP